MKSINLAPMKKKLEKIERRFEELEKLIQDPEVIKNQNLYTRYIKEHGNLNRIVAKYRELKKIKKEIEEAQEMIENEEDPEMKELAQEELKELLKKEEIVFEKLQDLLISDDEANQKNVIVEIRAGTGGEEACLFANDLYQMYLRYAEKNKWKVEILDSNPTDLGGYKEIIFSIKGKDVYKKMKYESGGHRVQRIPVTESSGRIHTSACTVVVLPEAEEIEVKIDPKELRIDTLRASGPGGQNVNKTSSAVRITHLPTGIVVTCQDTPEQYKNKMKAMRILRTRLMQKYKEDQQRERNELRRSQQGSGDRNDRIRTYNFPQNRVTDHRINLSIYNLEGVLHGELDEFIENLQRYEREQLIKELEKN